MKNNNDFICALIALGIWFLVVTLIIVLLLEI